MPRKTSIDRRSFLKGALFTGGGLMAANLFSFMQYRQARAQAGERLRAAMSSAGLAGTWNAQGQEAALRWGELLGVDITWFDGEFDPAIQRSKIDQMATEQWDFVAMQPGAIGTLVEPVQAMIDNGIPVVDMDTLIAPLDQLQSMGVFTFIAPNNVSSPLLPPITSSCLNRLSPRWSRRWAAAARLPISVVHPVTRARRRVGRAS